MGFNSGFKGLTYFRIVLHGASVAAVRDGCAKSESATLWWPPAAKYHENGSD